MILTKNPMTPHLSDIIIESLRDGILIVNSAGEIIYSNKAAQDLFTKTAETLLGQPFGFPILPTEIQEIEIFRNGKIRIAQMLANRIHWNGQEAYLLSLRDISELKKISRELELQKISLEKSNKDLEQYAYFVSHDLKEPIRKIMVFSSRLLDNKSVIALPDVKDQIEKISRCGARMHSLVTGIAEYSGYSATQNFAAVDLHEIVKGVLSDLEEQITEKNARLNVEVLPVVEANPIQMHQLFLNLISNAVKYAKDGLRPEVIIRHFNYDSYLEFSIIDNGIGFDTQYVDKIFEPFQRLHSNKFEGSGIGLAICKKIVEGHGGTIYAKSNPGQGSEFIFTLAKDLNLQHLS
jgi:light-regulated signal transduction histidine kinase (bacteriophytochrome)